MTYVHQGRQFILIPVAANAQTGTTAQLVAYSLPVPGGRGSRSRMHRAALGAQTRPPRGTALKHIIQRIASSCQIQRPHESHHLAAHALRFNPVAMLDPEAAA